MQEFCVKSVIIYFNFKILQIKLIHRHYILYDQKELVTRGLGYIGAHVCVKLLESNFIVVVIDNFCNSSRNIPDKIFEITAFAVSFLCLAHHVVRLWCSPRRWPRGATNPVKIHWNYLFFLPLFQGRWPSFDKTDSLANDSEKLFSSLGLPISVCPGKIGIYSGT